eukprot:g40198.t1
MQVEGYCGWSVERVEQISESANGQVGGGEILKLVKSIFRSLSLEDAKGGHVTRGVGGVAFCAWIVTNILFSMSTIVYGGYMALVTSAFMIFGVISFATVQNVSPCIIQFGPATLKTNFSGSFWLTLATEKLRTFFMLNGEEDDDNEMNNGLINHTFTDEYGNALHLK